MANLKFSQFNNTAPSATTSFLVGYDTLLNDNIRFKESDLDLADMGGLLDLGSQVTGAIDLATQVSGLLDLSTNSTGTINLATQGSGFLPEANGGTGVGNMYNAQPIGRKGVRFMNWDSGFLNVPRGAEYMVPFNVDGSYGLNGFTSGVRVGYSSTPSGLVGLVNTIPGALAASSAWRVTSAVNRQLFKITWRAYFFDMTADLDIQAGAYASDNSNFVGYQKFLCVKDSANETTDSRMLTGEFYYETPGSDTTVLYYFLPYIRFDNGASDPYPAYDSGLINAVSQFIIEQIY